MFEGRKLNRYRTWARQSASSSAMKLAMPERLAWVFAPPSSSNDTASPVTALITSGPVMNM